MKRSLFLTLFFSTQICLILLHIQKHIHFIKHSFAKQKAERIHNELVQKKELLQQQLCTLQSQQTIKEFAEKELLMHPIRLTQIKKLEHHDR